MMLLKQRLARQCQLMTISTSMLKLGLDMQFQHSYRMLLVQWVVILPKRTC